MNELTRLKKLTFHRKTRSRQWINFLQIINVSTSCFYRENWRFDDKNEHCQCIHFLQNAVSLRYCSPVKMTKFRTLTALRESESRQCKQSSANWRLAEFQLTLPFCRRTFLNFTSLMIYSEDWYFFFVCWEFVHQVSCYRLITSCLQCHGTQIHNWSIHAQWTTIFSFLIRL